jgi:hypothetical protein
MTTSGGKIVFLINFHCLRASDDSYGELPWLVNGLIHVLLKAVQFRCFSTSESSPTWDILFCTTWQEAKKFFVFLIVELD